MDEQTISRKLLELNWALSNIKDSGMATADEEHASMEAVFNINTFRDTVINHPDTPAWIIASSIMEERCKINHSPDESNLLVIYSYTLPDPSILALKPRILSDGYPMLTIDLRDVPGLTAGGLIYVSNIGMDREGVIPWLVVVDLTGLGSSRVAIRTRDPVMPEVVHH